MTGEQPGRKRPPSQYSARWLRRQATDLYVKAAHRKGYRSRAAFKLIALDDKYRLLKPGRRVVDLGAAPGGWTQVAVERVQPPACAKPERLRSGEGRPAGGGAVVAVDLQAMAPVAGATVIAADVAAPDLAARLLAALGGKADLVLSDMASATTGHAETDHLRTLGLAEAALELACRLLKPGGAFLVKLRQGAEEPAFFAAVGRRFAKVERAKPPASRAESAELYIVARGFKGGGYRAAGAAEG